MRQQTSPTFKHAKNSPVTLNRDPAKAMQEMMDCIDDLRGVYERETQALLASDTKGFLAVQDEKFERAKLYQHGIEELLARKEEMRSVEPSVRKRLEKMQNDFSELAQENMTALQRMQRSMERLSDTIRMAVKDTVKKERGVNYNAVGKIQDGGTRKGISTGSISTTV